MSDVPSVVNEIAITAQTTAEPSATVWPYVVGTIIAIVAFGFWAYKRINKPDFVIKQIRRKNLKAMKKEGIESNEASEDLDRLLSSIETHADEKKLSGADVIKLLMPLNDKNRMKSAKDMYSTLHYIAKEIGDNRLANEFKNKTSGVKSNSKLMAGLMKRAGI